ncbi:hypothetical protein HZA41_01650 [Candidatus Peregrinibacteria bacterium]|nr:hypothetical protein [Candidatus Peregrinibacteria bacterium]
MQQYKNFSGQSHVIAYENGDGYIKVKFASGYWTLYTYTNTSAGLENIQQMQQLAVAGQGFNSFISHYKPFYENKC